jgi:hypothetical protein
LPAQPLKVYLVKKLIFLKGKKKLVCFDSPLIFLVVLIFLERESVCKKLGFYWWIKIMV